MGLLFGIVNDWCNYYGDYKQTNDLNISNI